MEIARADKQMFYSSLRSLIIHQILHQYEEPKYLKRGAIHKLTQNRCIYRETLDLVLQIGSKYGQGGVSLKIQRVCEPHLCMAPDKTCRFTSARQMLSVVLEQIIGIISYHPSLYPQVHILQRAQLQADLRGAEGAHGAGRVPPRPRVARQVRRRRQHGQEGRQEHLRAGQPPEVGALIRLLIHTVWYVWGRL